MHTVKSSHGEVLAGALFLPLLSSDDGIVSSKLSRIRKVNSELRQASADGFETVALQWAKMTALDGGEAQPVVKMNTATPPEPQAYQLSGTKVYELKDDTPETLKAFNEALNVFLKGEVELQVPELTVADMGKIKGLPGGTAPNGALLQPVADALLPFAPPL